MMERIYLDSYIVIYLVERHPLYEPLLRKRLEGSDDRLAKSVGGFAINILAASQSD